MLVQRLNEIMDQAQYLAHGGGGATVPSFTLYLPLVLLLLMTHFLQVRCVWQTLIEDALGEPGFMLWIFLPHNPIYKEGPRRFSSKYMGEKSRLECLEDLG